MKRIGWIKGKENSADELAMYVVLERSQLWRLMKQNELITEVLG